MVSTPRRVADRSQRVLGHSFTLPRFVMPARAFSKPIFARFVGHATCESARVIRFVSVLLLVAACSSSTAGEHLDLGMADEAGATDGGPTEAAPRTEAQTADAGSLEDALASMGFDVAHGALAFPPIDCCAAVTCFGNNPSSPYGEFFVPRGPGQTAANPAERADGSAPAWRLREDEAIVYVGPTPPHVGYFGFTPYLFNRQNGAMRDNIFASVSDTLNDDVIHTAGGAGAPFASRTAIVLAANATTRAKVHTSLTTGGVPEAEINDLVIPESTVHLGLDDTSDTVSVLMRVALFDSDAQKAAYLAAPGGAVYRVTPRVTIVPAPETAQANRPRGTGTNESARSADVAALHDAIVAAHPGSTALELNDTALAPNPSECISTGRGCNGDNRDALYSAMTPFRLKDGDQLVVYGVDHHTERQSDVFQHFGLLRREALRSREHRLARLARECRGLPAQRRSRYGSFCVDDRAPLPDRLDALHRDPRWLSRRPSRSLRGDRIARVPRACNAHRPDRLGDHPRSSGALSAVSMRWWVVIFSPRTIGAPLSGVRLTILLGLTCSAFIACGGELDGRGPDNAGAGGSGASTA